MAKIEIIKDGIYSMEMFNVEAKVGAGGLNGWSDVVIVQALLKYSREFGKDFAPHLPKLGQPTGASEPWLGELIKAYQADTNRQPHRKTKLKVDGVIGKARGTGGWGAGQRWTIVDLNYSCEVIFLAVRSTFASDYKSDIRKLFPQVNTALGAFPLAFPF